MLLLLAAAAATAAPPDIVVTGDPLAAPPGEAAFDVARIDRDRLDANASNRLEDVLRDVAGFAQYRRSNSTSAQPTSQGATLRGLGGNASSRALVLLDGVPFADPFGGWLSFSAIDPERLGAVRVVRGGGSGVAGPGALAGTIELQSANPDQLTPAWADIAYGSRDAVDAHAGVSGRAGGGFAFLSAAYARGDGFVPIVAADRGPVDQRAPYRQFSLSGRAVFPVGGDAELQANGLLFSDHRTRGTAFTPNDTQGQDVSLRLVGRGRWGYEALAYLQNRRFSAGFATINAARTTVSPSLDQYSVPSGGVGGRVEVRPPLGTVVQLRVGADTRALTGQTDEFYQYTAGVPANRRQAGGETLAAGAFAEASAEPAVGLTLTAGGRIDRWWINDGFTRLNGLASGAVLVGTTRYADRRGTRPAGRAGVAWAPGEGPVTLRAAAYLGWRLPTLNELFRPYRLGQDSYLANPLLRPERLRGLDGGVDFRPLPNLTLSATGFTNRLEDAVGNVTQAVSATGARTYARLNLPAVRSAGAELDARLVYGPWRATLSYALTDARVEGEGATAALDGKRPAQVAREQLSGTLAWNPSRFVASATVRYVGPQWEDDRNTERLYGAVTVDGVVRVPLGRRFAVELRGENLADARVETGISGADVVERATPRTLWVGVRYGGR
jgi:outer membrane receptor protein involved in Fe transport